MRRSGFAAMMLVGLEPALSWTVVEVWQEGAILPSLPGRHRGFKAKAVEIWRAKRAKP